MQHPRGWRFAGWGRSASDLLPYPIEGSLRSLGDEVNWTARANLAIALLVARKKSEALAAYDAAVEMATAENLAQLTTDLEQAVAKHDSLIGADEARARIESRRAALEGRTTD